MFVTEDLLKKVDELFRVIEVRASFVQDLAKQENAWWEDPVSCWAAERALHVSIECAADAANHMIDALVMRDPGGYGDIFRILMEEQVVTKNWFDTALGLIAFREQLVHGYHRIQPVDVRSAVVSYAKLFPEFMTAVRSYLASAS